MRRRISMVIASMAIAALAALLPLTSASAAETASTATAASATALARQWYGPYPDRGTCEFWRAGVAAANPGTSPVCLPFPESDGTPGWYFYVDS